jgi:DNA-binding response OmpR family regulator
MRILLVEDDPVLGSGIRIGLERTGYTVDWMMDGGGALQALLTESFDLMILDLGLPKVDGLSLLKKLRDEDDKLPVLILSARDSVMDKISGLDHGADDYLIKPFDLDELQARVRALLRRKADRAAPVIRYGELKLDPAARSVTFKGQPVALPTKEFVLLELLLDNAGRVLSRDQIEERLYGWRLSVESNTTEVHVHYLRKKFGKELIVTVRGAGYMVPKIS